MVESCLRSILNRDPRREHYRAENRTAQMQFVRADTFPTVEWKRWMHSPPVGQREL